MAYDNDIMKLTPFNPSPNSSNRPLFGATRFGSANPFSAALQQQAPAAFKPLQPQGGEQRFLFNFEGKRIEGGGLFNRLA
jgi:hypothetical protein